MVASVGCRASSRRAHRGTFCDGAGGGGDRAGATQHVHVDAALLRQDLETELAVPCWRRWGGCVRLPPPPRQCSCGRCAARSWCPFRASQHRCCRPPNRMGLRASQARPGAHERPRSSDLPWNRGLHGAGWFHSRRAVGLDPACGVHPGGGRALHGAVAAPESTLRPALRQPPETALQAAPNRRVTDSFRPRDHQRSARRTCRQRAQIDRGLLRCTAGIYCNNLSAWAMMRYYGACSTKQRFKASVSSFVV